MWCEAFTQSCKPEVSALGYYNGVLLVEHLRSALQTWVGGPEKESAWPPVTERWGAWGSSPAVSEPRASGCCPAGGPNTAKGRVGRS